MKLFIVGDNSAKMDLVVIANDAPHAFNLWKAYYADWDKPDQIRVYQLPAPHVAGVVRWQDIRSIEFKVYQ
jgi:hypothetical protein